MTRWESDRRDQGAIRGAVVILVTYAIVLGLVVAIGALFHDHPVPTLTGAIAVVGLYLWIFRDRPDTTLDDTTEDPS